MNDFDGRVTMAVLGEQLTQVVLRVDKLIESVDRLVESGHKRDMDMTSVRLALAGVEKFGARLDQSEDDIKEMQPWVRGLRWGLIIIGGVIILTLFGGLLWAVAQSGGLLQ